VKVTDTAAIIARVRAEESELPPEARLFVDPFARLFAGGLERGDGADQFGAVPFLREAIRVRTKFIDDFVRRGTADGIRQIVILGAGFDCRALRLEEIATTGSWVYEVDFAEQLATKRAVLDTAAVPIPKFVRFVPCDFTADNFESLLSVGLAGEGFSAGALTLFTWEGVISYLNPSEIDRTLRWMASVGAPGSRVVFNYSINNLSGTDPDGMSSRAKAAGFSSVDDRSLGSLYREYLTAEPPSDVAELFRLAVSVR